MQTKQQLIVNGQELQQSDFNNVASVAALADDAVFAEFLRVPQNGLTVAGCVGGIYRGILPFYSRGLGQGSATVKAGIVQPIAASSGVTILPFRAVVGATSGADEAASLRDIRTVVYDPGATPLSTPVITFAANVDPTNTRWDLIYATVMRDANAASVTRYVKDPATKQVAAQSIVTQVATTVTLGVQAGTVSASPVFPAAPSDPVGGYVIPIAYVRIPGLFGSLYTTVANTDICELAVCSPMPGDAMPAEFMWTTAGVLTTAAQTAWGNSGTRTPSFLGPTMQGVESRFFALDLSDASSANWNVAAGQNLDTTVDWRNRIFKVWISIGSNPAGKWAWEPTASLISCIPNKKTLCDTAVQMTASMPGSNSPIAYIDPTVSSYVNGGSTVTLVVTSSAGVLTLQVTGTPLCKLFIWLEATGQVPHRS